MTPELQKKVDFAIKLIQSAEQMAKEKGQPVEVAYSGGKDSDVILELAKMAGVNYRAIYKNTTIDPPGTIKHAIDVGAEILKPKKDFRTLLTAYGYPSRLRRFCCKYLKEYKVLDYSIVGIRRDESVKRATRYKEPESCRVYSDGKKCRQYMPILEWTKEEVAEFIAERGIKCHALYYDEEGNFHPERRLGCMCCVLKSKKLRIEDFKKYPGMIKLYLNTAGTWMERKPEAHIHRYCNDKYEQFVMELFCDNVHDFQEKYGRNLFGERIDCKKFIEDYFNIQLPDYPQSTPNPDTVSDYQQPQIEKEKKQ